MLAHERRTSDKMAAGKFYKVCTNLAKVECIFKRIARICVRIAYKMIARMLTHRTE